MGFLVFLLIGLIAGWVASIIVEGHGLGAFADIIVGIVGAFIGGFFFRMIGVTPYYGFWGAVGMSAIGAVIFLFIVEVFTISQRPRRPLS